MDDDLLQMELDLVNIKILAMQTQAKAIVYQLKILKQDDPNHKHVATMIKERRTSLKMSKEVIKVLNRAKGILLGHGL